MTDQLTQAELEAFGNLSGLLEVKVAKNENEGFTYRTSGFIRTSQLAKFAQHPSAPVGEAVAECVHNGSRLWVKVLNYTPLTHGTKLFLHPSPTDGELVEALETIAAYPMARDQEMSVTAMRKIAREALASREGK